MKSQRITTPKMLRTIEIAVKKPLHTTPSIIQFLQQSKSQVMQREKESDVVLQRMRIGSEIPLITLSDGVAIRWWVQEGVPGKYSYKPWYSNVFRFAYTLGEQYMKEGKEFKDPADAINHVYIQFLSQRENASLVFPDKKEARKPELELRTLFIKQKMDSQGYVVLDVKELQQNDGKNNQGAFIVTALNKDAIASDKPECFFVKVVRELNNFKDLIKRQEGVEAADPKKSVPRMTADQLNLNSATVSINRLSDSKLSLWCLGALFDCCISRDKPFHPLTPPSDLRQYAVENRQEIRISQSLY